MARIMRIDEFFDGNDVTATANENGGEVSVDFRIGGNVVGHAIITGQHIEQLVDEYYGSVDDFNEHVFNRFDYWKKVYNLEDFWIEKKFRGRGYSDLCLDKLMEMYKDKQMVLRAFPDGDVDEDTLVRIYSRHGFVVLQETESDGTIMGRYI